MVTTSTFEGDPVRGQECHKDVKERVVRPPDGSASLCFEYRGVQPARNVEEIGRIHLLLRKAIGKRQVDSGLGRQTLEKRAL